MALALQGMMRDRGVLGHKVRDRDLSAMWREPPDLNLDGVEMARIKIFL